MSSFSVCLLVVHTKARDFCKQVFVPCYFAKIIDCF